MPMNRLPLLNAARPPSHSVGLGRRDALRFADRALPTMRQALVSLRQARRPRSRSGPVPDAQAGRQDGHTHHPAEAGAETQARLAEYRRFRQLSKMFIEVNDALSEARLATGSAAKKNRRPR